MKLITVPICSYRMYVCMYICMYVCMYVCMLWDSVFCDFNKILNMENTFERPLGCYWIARCFLPGIQSLVSVLSITLMWCT